jgi:hypothetical protein
MSFQSSFGFGEDALHVILIRRRSAQVGVCFRHEESSDDEKHWRTGAEPEQSRPCGGRVSVQGFPEYGG